MSHQPQRGVFRKLRLSHERLVLDALARVGPMSRGELIEATGLSRSTTFDIVGDLLVAGTIERMPRMSETGRRGRPAHKVALNPSAGLYLGVDIGRRHGRAVFANAAHETIARVSIPLVEGQDRTSKATAMVSAVRQLVGDRQISLARLRGVAVGLPGQVNRPDRGLGGQRLVDDARAIRTLVEQEFNVPAEVENNTRLAALAESRWGAAREHECAVLIRLSDGVSAGILHRGELVTGANDLAGELGHVVVDRWGSKCYCGSSGCLETILGIPALIAGCANKGVSVAGATELLQLAKQGDPRVRGVVEDALERLIPTMMVIVTVMDPSIVIVGGELAQLGSLITARLKAALHTEALPATSRRLDIVPTALGEDSAALGAIALLIEADSKSFKHETIEPHP